jgi:nucleotide-binding universal stress UspA family protein
MYTHILVPVDGSPTSDRGLDEAVKLAKLTGARLRLIHVVEQLVYAAGIDGFDGVGRVFMGSDAEQIVRLAPTPVLLVRSGEAVRVAAAPQATQMQ